MVADNTNLFELSETCLNYQKPTGFHYQKPLGFVLSETFGVSILSFNPS